MRGVSNDLRAREGCAAHLRHGNEKPAPQAETAEQLRRKVRPALAGAGMEGVNPMNPNADDQVISLLIIVAVVAVLFYRRRWRGSGTAYGTAAWMTDKALRAAGMLAGYGLILGRTFKGALIRLP